MKKISVGIVGVGHLGEAHLKKYLSMPEAELAGFWDIDEEVRRTVQKKYGIPACESLDKLLERVEAVSVVVPTSEHAEVAAAAAERCVHIFVEKPIAASLSEADRIIEAAHKNRLKLQVGHIERFNSAFRSLFGGELPSGGRGSQIEQVNPRFIESHRLASFSSRGMDVSVILDLMIHDIDLILRLMRSPIEKIDTSGVGVISDSFDIVNARLRFEDGAAANVTASRISQKKMRKMRLFQKDSYISMDFVTGETEIFRMADLREDFGNTGMMPVLTLDHKDVTKKIGYKKFPDDGKDALELELRSFLDSIHNDTDPPVTGEQARQTLEIALQIAENTS